MRSIACVALAALTAAGSNGYPHPGSTTSVQGVVISIDRSRVTLQTSPSKTIAMDDQLAINNGTAQSIAVGRAIVAYGYWSGPTFYATAIALASLSGPGLSS